MNKTIVRLAALGVLLVVIYFGYQLIDKWLNPCDDIFRQSVVSIGAKLDVVKAKGEVAIGSQKIQELDKSAHQMAVNLKTCCIVCRGRATPEFLRCKEGFERYDAAVRKVASSIEDELGLDLSQFHFHAPGEHTLAGKRFPMELHLVNRSADGRIAVLGVLIASGAENPNLDGLLAAAPARSGEERELHGRLDPADLVPPGKAYRYRGSLTTPPCTENVRWTVLAQPLTLSPGEIAAFTRLYRGDNRPLQPLNGRELFIVG